MKKIYFTVLIIFIFKTGFSQEINFDIHNTTLEDYIKMEEKLGSERIPNTSYHISFSGEAQPIRYKRKEKIIPDLIVEYYFKKKDSTMSYILYEWDVNNFEKKDNNKKNKKFEKALMEKYLNLKEKISNIYGKPIVKSNYSNIAELDAKNLFEESSTWTPNDSTEIKMNITISNYYEKKGGITINPTHRIRLYIKKKSKKEQVSLKLDDDKINELDLIAKSFFAVLAEKDIEKSKSFFSKAIVGRINEKIMNQIINNVNFKKELELVYSGTQITMTGKRYAILNYIYSDDNKNKPMTIIKLMFDDDNKIIGFIPMIRNKTTIK